MDGPAIFFFGVIHDWTDTSVFVTHLLFFTRYHFAPKHFFFGVRTLLCTVQLCAKKKKIIGRCFLTGRPARLVYVGAKKKRPFIAVFYRNITSSKHPSISTGQRISSSRRCMESISGQQKQVTYTATTTKNSTTNTYSSLLDCRCSNSYITFDDGKRVAALFVKNNIVPTVLISYLLALLLFLEFVWLLLFN